MIDFMKYAEDGIVHMVAVSGGKDSAAMALELRRREPSRSFLFVCTPTGDELPEVATFRERLSNLLASPIHEIRAKGGTLIDYARKENCLPSTRMRWCTRQLKIQPYEALCLRIRAAGFKIHSYVGLRADEEERTGLYGPYVDRYCYPLREWGWGLAEVLASVRFLDLPWRTDCALCPYQRLGEWRRLAQDYPEIYERGVELEKEILTNHGS